MPRGSYTTSSGGRVFGLMFALLAGVIAALGLWSAFEGFTTGTATLSPRGGRGVRISLSGWRAYLSSAATLLLGLSCLSVSAACVFGSLTPPRYADRVGPSVHRLLLLGWRFLVSAGVIAFVTAVSYFFR